MSVFWDDLNEDLQDLELAAEYEAESERISQEIKD